MRFEINAARNALGNDPFRDLDAIDNGLLYWVNELGDIEKEQAMNMAFVNAFEQPFSPPVSQIEGPIEEFQFIEPRTFITAGLSPFFRETAADYQEQKRRRDRNAALNERRNRERLIEAPIDEGAERRYEFLLRLNAISPVGNQFMDVVEGAPRINGMIEMTPEIDAMINVTPYRDLLGRCFVSTQPGVPELDTLVDLTNESLFDIMEAMRFFCFYEVQIVQENLRGRLYSKFVWTQLVSSLFDPAQIQDEPNRNFDFWLQTVLTNYQANPWMRDTPVIRNFISMLGLDMQTTDNANRQIEIGTFSFIVRFVFRFVRNGLAWDNMRESFFRNPLGSILYNFNIGVIEEIMWYNGLVELFRHNVEGECMIYFLFQRSFVRTEQDGDHSILVEHVIPGRLLNVSWRTDQGYEVPEGLDDFALFVKKWLLKINAGAGAGDWNSKWDFVMVRPAFSFTDQFDQVISKEVGYFRVEVEFILHHGFDIDEIARVIADSFWHAYRTVLGLHQEQYGEDYNADDPLATHRPSLAGMVLHLDPVHAQNAGTFLHLRQVLAANPAVFCRKSLGKFKKYSCFSQLTDRLCLFETWHQMINYEKWDGEWKNKTCDLKRKIIYADFLEACPVLQSVCVQGDINKFIEYCELKLPFRFNWFIWEIAGSNTDWTQSRKFTLVFKDAHVILCLTKSISKEVMTKWYKTQKIQKPKPGVRYQLRPKEAAFEIDREKQIDYAWDVETCRDAEGKMIPYCLCIANIHKEEVYSFKGLQCIQDFLKWIALRADFDHKNKKSRKNKPTRIVLWGFNTHRFDCMFLLPHLIALFPQVDLLGTMTKVRKLTVGTNIEFFDLWCCAPYGKLADIVKSWLPNTTYIKGEIPHHQITVENWEQWLPEVEPYCENDCIILGACVRKWLEYNANIKTNPYVMSVSQWALDWFRMKYLKEDIEGLKFGDYKRIKDTYSGGICLHIMKELKEGNCYDSNSCYPWAMTQDVPYEHLGYRYVQEEANENNFDQIEDCWIYYTCDYEWKESFQFPFFIERGKDGCVMFYSKKPNNEPVGIWGESLKFALKHKLLKKPILITGFDAFKFKPVFKEFVEAEYALRLIAKAEGRTFDEQLHKGRLNNLYGKFAQMLQYLSKWMGTEEFVYQLKMYKDTNWIKNMHTPARGVWNVEYDSIDYQNSVGGLIFIPSKITDRCRLAWVKVAMAATELGLPVAYGDTDSLHIEGTLPETHEIYDKLELPNPLLSETKLGCFKIEYAFTKAIYCAKKVYILEMKPNKKNMKYVIKMKGVPIHLLQSDPDIWKKFENMKDTGKFDVEIPEMWHRKPGYVQIKSLTKHLLVEPKRNFIDNRNSRPL